MLKTILKAKLNKDYEKIIVARINEIAKERKSVATVPGSHYNLYLQATSLNGFNYLAFTIVCSEEMKSVSGCTLTFKTKNNEYVLKSESDNIDSDYSHKSSIGVTLVDTDLLEDFEAFVKANKFTEIKIDSKVGQVFKKDVTFSFTEVNMEEFRASMVPKEAESTGDLTNPVGGGSSTGL